MRRVMQQVLEFHETFGLAIGDKPHVPNEELQQLRMRLLEEEYHEYRYAERAKDLVKIADGLADMVYIIAGTAIAYGIPLDLIFNEVHRSNMTKLNEEGLPEIREDGKVMKSDLYESPKIADILCETIYGEDA